MSDPVVFSRRDFLKLVGIGVAGAAAGCAKPPAETLLPYLVAPEDILPGVPYWYASTCRECPAACGVLVKAREGRAIKVEGNADHPVGSGGLCARGQASLQGLYDPDRLAKPQVKNGAGWTPMAWDAALAAAAAKLGEAKGRVLVLTGFESGSFRTLAGSFASAFGGKHVMWEPFGYEAVRAANAKTFGTSAVANLDVASARCLVSFGADFLETFGSPVAQMRGFAAMRTNHADGFGHFVAVEPRLSLTGANADEWVAAAPGSEYALALGMAHVILAENLGPALAEKSALAAATAAFTPEAVAQQTGVAAETVQRLARMFAKQAPSLAVAGGVATQGTQATALVGAVNLLNYAAGNVGRTVRFERATEYEGLSTFAEFSEVVKQMAAGAYGAVVVLGANPAYSTPGWLGFAEAFAKVPYKLSLAGALDETAALCDAVLPTSHAIESFGDATHVRGVWSLQQPAMKRLPMFDARPAGDALIALGKGAGVGAAWPENFHDFVRDQWKAVHARFGQGRDFDQFWTESLAKGGVWAPAEAAGARWTGSVAFAANERSGSGDLSLVLTPSNNFYDGRGANRPWLQELPDMTSKTVWGSWVEIHPETAGKLGVRNGDPLKVQTSAGSVEAPAYLYAGIRRDTIALALGQGHTSYGRYASGRGVNALALVPQATDALSGALAYQSAKASVSRGTQAMRLYEQQAEKNQHDRHIAQLIPIATLLAGGKAETIEHAGSFPGHYPAGDGVSPVDPSMTKLGKFTEPKARPEGYVPPAHSVSAFEPELKARHPGTNPVNVGSYAHAKHRWAMTVDLNRCTGCAACVTACYAENNIPVVGPDLMRRGREMAWLRIDRFEERLEAPANGATAASDVRFVPMMCQHCGDAPCEMVCPVYATYHSSEGLNAQVYNRCVGTRYCSNNCPYKVRAFNFFDYSAPEKTTFAFPEPLNWQLNPDVTVRSKGVMEKCTMCVQRILEGKGNAKDEHREVRDGEIQTACSQSCPAQAITFGDLLDPNSAVHQKSYGERRYWVLEELHTRPGVTYLQRVSRSESHEAHA